MDLNFSLASRCAGETKGDYQKRAAQHQEELSRAGCEWRGFNSGTGLFYKDEPTTSETCLAYIALKY